MTTTRPSASHESALRFYVGGLTLSVVLLLAGTVLDDRPAAHMPEWAILIALFVFADAAELFFHQRGGRQSLAFQEAVLVPMIVALAFTEVVWGVALAMVIEMIVRRSDPLIRNVFNLAQQTLSAAAAAGVWVVLADNSGTLSARNAAVAVLSVFVYTMVNHVLVAGALWLSEGEPLLRLLRSIAPATLLNAAGNVVLGLLLAASLAAGSWTLVLFPTALIALFLGYRAMLRVGGESERVQRLHDASRALASSPDLKKALAGFLTAIADIASAAEARVVLKVPTGLRWSGVREGVPTAALDRVVGGPLEELFERMRREPVSVVATQDGGGPESEVRAALHVASLIAVPLIDGDFVVGCLMAADRLGADEFSEDERRLLEALANELVVTLDSYRLFQEVSEERERFRRIFSGSKEGICLLDDSGVVHAWSPALERMTGYDEADVVDEVWSDRVLIRDRKQRRLERLDLVRTPFDSELELVTRQGPTRWVGVTAGPVSAGEGKGWVVLVRDLTSEHAAEEAKSDFLSTISHELRTPLTTIKGSLHALSRGPANLKPETFEQMIGVLRRGSDRLERLVMNLLLVSQMEGVATGPPPFRDEVKFEPLVRDRAQRIFDEHSNWSIEVREADLEVRGDRERLGHAVEHLFDNAMKFGSQGAVTIELWRDNGWAHLSVTDEGAGIPAADQMRIFERFVRLGDPLTRETQGAGVGLFIAQRSIEAMGGSIWVESEPGAGATFHVRIPLAHPAAVEATTA